MMLTINIIVSTMALISDGRSESVAHANEITFAPSMTMSKNFFFLVETDFNPFKIVEKSKT